MMHHPQPPLFQPPTPPPPFLPQHPRPSKPIYENYARSPLSTNQYVAPPSPLFTLMASASIGPDPHRRNSPFFKRRHQDWSLANYLAYRHHRSKDPDRIIDSWRPSLENIASCKLECHNDNQRSRALRLLALYDEKGAGSDRVAGRHWLQKQRKALTAPPAQTINFTPVFNSNVVNSSFAVNAGGTGPVADEAPESPSASARAYGPDNAEDDVGEQEGAEVADDPLPSTVGGSVLADERVIESLTATYRRQTNRWRLASGRDVETVLFENCRRMSFPASSSSLALSFTIDLDDPNMRSWFEPEELHEINKSLPEPPSTPGILSMVQSLHRFRSCKNPADVRKVLATTSFLEPGQTYDTERDFLRMWADLVIRNLLVLWESPAHPLRSQQLEDFYSNLIWAPILDQCFLSFPSIVLVRKDSPCRSTAARKNRARTLDTRMRQGRRLDGVIRSTGDEAHEFGGMEVARSAAGGLKSTKRLGDEEKLLKALRDMLAVLCGLVKVSGEDMPSLQVVGVLCAGLKMQVIKMGCLREGGVAVVRRQQVVEIPEELNGLSGLTKVLVMVASMKAVVEQTAKAISQRHNPTSSTEKSDEDLIKEILEGTAAEAALGWAADTPSPER